MALKLKENPEALREKADYDRHDNAGAIREVNNAYTHHDFRSEVYIAGAEDRKKEMEKARKVRGTASLFTWILDAVFGTRFGRFFRRNRW